MKPIDDDWIETYTGRQHWLFSVDKNEYVIEDIAHALSLICRFTGHCRFHYSVAQHSVYVARLVPREYACRALLHDAAEAYLSDISRPVKGLLPQYKVAEKRVQRKILATFGLSPINAQADLLIKRADNAMLLAEARDLMPGGGKNWTAGDYGIREKPARIMIEQWVPEHAEQMFLTNFHFLKCLSWSWPNGKM